MENFIEVYNQTLYNNYEFHVGKSFWYLNLIHSLLNMFYKIAPLISHTFDTKQVIK